MAQSLASLMRSRGLEPREVTFGEPWEARAFALALALAERDAFKWDEFRDRLITAIAESDQANAAGQPGSSYYQCWLDALEQAITARGIASLSEIDHRAEAIAAHPPARNKASTRGPVKID